MGLGQIFPGDAPPLSERLLGKGWRGEGDDSSTELIHDTLDRLRRQHLFGQGTYLRLRSLLPVPALAFVWLSAVWGNDNFSFYKLVNSSIALRHLLLGAVIVLLWELMMCARSSRPGRSLRKDIRAEVSIFVYSSVSCGFFLFALTAKHLGILVGAELGASLMSTLITESLLLLLGATLVCATGMAGCTRKALLVGSGRRASILRKLTRRSHSRLDIVGCLDDEYVGSDAAADNYLGKTEVLASLLKAQPVELVLIGLPVKSQYEQIQRVIDICESAGVECQYMGDVFATSRVTLQSPSAPSDFAVLGDPPRDLRHWIKRGVDLLLAGALSLILLPLAAVIAVAIKLTSPGPVFFVQQRYGYNRRRFPMFKFRTMVVDAEKRQAELEAMNEAAGPVFKLRADPRITRVGAFLRRTSLDEIPQLLNVLRGEMSLVGPRPLPLRDVSRFDKPRLLRRFSVPPGLTCLWQVGGRSNTQFDEWIRLDLQYIDEWSLGLDFRILAQTIPAVLRGHGAM